MNNKKKIIIIILILFIIFFSGYFLIKNNGTLFNNTKNTSLNNGSLNGSNMSFNEVNSSDNMSDNLTNQNSHLNQYDNPYEKYNYGSNGISEEDKILERVRDGVWWYDSQGRNTHDVKLGKPYKSKNGLWLVGAFDKKTGEFLGSVWTPSDEGGYYGGVDSYSEYKKIISGKYRNEHDSNKYDEKSKSNHVVEEKPSIHDIHHVLSAANPNAKDNYPSSNIPLDTQSESVVELDANQQYSTEFNSQNTEIINEE